jgi:ribosome-binding protein aMBF1 (putative translation factor)
MLCRAYRDAHVAEGVVEVAAERLGLHGRHLAETQAADVVEASRYARRLGRRVRTLREEQGWTQTELARTAGMTQPAVARFEAGGTVPTIPVLDRLARALGADLVVELRRRSAAG